MKQEQDVIARRESDEAISKDGNAFLSDSTDSLRELPQGWVRTRLGEIVQSVGKVSPKVVPHQEFTYIDIASIAGYSIATPKKYLGKEAPSRARQLLKSGDVLFSTVRTYLKHIAMVGQRYDGQIASTGLCVIRPWPCIDSKLVFYLVQTDTFLNPLTHIQRGTSYPAVRDSDVFAQPLLLSPLPEQHRIVAKIEELSTRLDAGVEALNKTKAQLKRYRQAFLRDAFQGKLTQEWRESHKEELEPASALLERIKEERRKNAKGKYEELPPLDTSALPDLPEGWVWARVRELCDLINGRAFKSTEWSSQGLPIIRIQNLNDLHADFNYCNFEVEDKYFVNDGQLLFAWSGTPETSFGAHIWNRGLAVLNQHIFKVLIQEDRISKTFLVHLINHHITEFIGKAHGTAGLAHITKGKFEDSITALPPFSEQCKIAEEIERHFSVADEIQRAVAQSLKQAKRLRQGILRRAFEGKLVPQDPDDEPAEKLLQRIKEERVRQQTEAKNTEGGKGKALDQARLLP